VTAPPSDTTPLPAEPAATAAATENPVTIFGGYTWAEYRNNVSVTMPPNPRSSWIYRVRIERSMGKYRERPAVHFKLTTITDYAECCTNNVPSVTKDGWIAVTDMYYDPSTDAFLGGTLKETIKGNEQPAEDLAPVYRDHHREDKPVGDMGITPFGGMNTAFESMGRESVTVPAGTFPDARKITGTFRDGTPITFWVSPGIPVPVQYQFPNKDLDGIDPFQSFELESWG
jgi:hypothetical protein